MPKIEALSSQIWIESSDVVYLDWYLYTIYTESRNGQNRLSLQIKISLKVETLRILLYIYTRMPMLYIMYSHVQKSRKVLVSSVHTVHRNFSVLLVRSYVDYE